MFSDAVINFWVNTKEGESGLDRLQKKFDQTVGAISGAVVGGLGIKSIAGVYDETLKLVNLSERWQIPVEKVSQFANAFALFGGDTESAINAVERFQQMANNLRFHSSGPLRELSAVIGANLYNKDYMGVIEGIRSQFGKLNKNAQVEVMNMLGFDDNTMQRMLKASNEEWAAMLEKASKFGTVSEKSAAAIRKMDITLATIKQAFKAIVGSSIERLVPVFEKISGWLENVAVMSDDTKVGIVGLLGAFTLLGPAIKLAGLMLSTFFSPMTLIIAAIAGAAYLLYQNWDKVNAAFQSYLEESPRLKEFLEFAGKGFQLLGDGIKWLVDNFSGWFPGFLENMKLILQPFKWLYQVIEWVIGKLYDGAAAIGESEAGYQSKKMSYDYAGAFEKYKNIKVVPKGAAAIASQSYQTSMITNQANNQTVVDRGVTIQSVILSNVTDSRSFMSEMSSIAQNNASPLRGR